MIGTDAQQRNYTGNMVPAPAARAMAGEIGETLLLAIAGEAFTLSSKQIWVRRTALALALPTAAGHMVR